MSTTFDTFTAPPCHDEIETLYQDEHLVLIDKPNRLLNLSNKNPQNLDSVHHRLVQICPGCVLVHRLDSGTPELMVVAHNKAINTALCQQSNQRTVTKVYSALSCGHPESDEGVIDAVIAKDPTLFPLMSICAPNSRLARSRYQVVGRFYHRQEKGTLFSLTRAQLTSGTGCARQLRTHYQQLGHPILGCGLYGGRLLSGTKQTSWLMLYANELYFRHPINGAWMNARNASPF